MLRWAPVARAATHIAESASMVRHMPLSYTLSYTPLIHSSHTLLSYTPLIHSSYTLLSYTPLIHSSHTLLSYTPLTHSPLLLLLHSSHTLSSHTLSTHTLSSPPPPSLLSYTLLSYTLLSHTLLSYTLLSYTLLSYTLLSYTLQVNPQYPLLEWFFTGCFGLDILVNFNTSVTGRNGVPIIARRAIAADYLKFWFWIDFVATFPFEMVTGDASGGDASAAKLGRLGKIFR
jgi:hypothetical protein